MNIKKTIASLEQANIESAELYTEIQDLREKLNKFKMKYIENMKYKKAVEKLQEDGILNSDLSQKIQF